MNIVLSTHSVWVEEMPDIPGIILRFFFSLCSANLPERDQVLDVKGVSSNKSAMLQVNCCSE